MSEKSNKDDVPVIDMSLDDKTVADEFIHAFTTIGFATLVNHGVEPTIIQNAFAASRRFFDLDLDQKQEYKFQGYESNRGFIPMGCETHDGRVDMKPDKKETFDIGNENEEGFENKWPQLPHGSFRDDMLTYFDAFDALHLKIMRLLAIGLGLSDPNFFVDRCNGNHENMRLLHYPSLAIENDKSKDDPIIRGNVHTDFGTITLLTQDNVGGLRAQRLCGSWVSIPPVEGAIVVNVGDMLQRWSANVLRATPHQVVDTVGSNSGDNGEQIIIPERHSIAFFCNANKDTLLECLEECVEKEGATRYPPINAHEYLTTRLSQTIAKETSD